MKKFRAIFEISWLGYDETTSERIIEAKDFEDAFYKSKSMEWGFEVYARIISLEEMKEE